jgi:pimeloyl-ACP methyl ester carboxylesterase
MLLNKLFLIVVFSLIIFPGCSANKQTPDLKREKIIYQQNLEEIFDGEHYYVDYKYGEFSLIELFDENNDIALLFLHGRGLHPNEQKLAYPIRTELSNKYNTYSIQLPVLKKLSSYYDYTKIFYDSNERIKSAIEYISAKNKDIIVVAHSCGVHMLMSLINKEKLSENIISLVLIGSGAVDKGQKPIYEYPYSKIPLPILDIYGEYDFNYVISKADERKRIIKTINNKSKQIQIKSSNHYHEDNSSELIAHVKKWLTNQ